VSTSPSPTDDTASLAVELDETASRFEGRLGAELVGVVDFLRRGSTIVITHTGTEPQWRGRGFAAVLTRSALDHARAHGLKVSPVCPYTASYIDEHPEYQDLLA